MAAAMASAIAVLSPASPPDFAGFFFMSVNVT
jgi:hypothetical protein